MDSCALKNEKFDFTDLKNWFLHTQRELPWRVRRDPYAVWISEVMLQQTQVAVVIPYFYRWIEKFPTITSLANASLEEVIKLWEGLGYYSRARNLHEGARYLTKHFQGEFPITYDEINQIKGLGPYTVAAILSFAFQQKQAVVDGNVLRVVTRWKGMEEDIAKASTAKLVRTILEKQLPEEEHWIVSEALIELGATVCQKKARCSECPLKSSCIAFRDGLTNQLPIKTKGSKTEYLFRLTSVIYFQDFVLLKKGKKGEVMSDLYEFPYFETTKDLYSLELLLEKIEQNFHLSAIHKKTLKHVKHSFTRYQVQLYPFLVESSEKKEIKNYEWIKESELPHLAFSSGHRRILSQLSNQ